MKLGELRGAIRKTKGSPFTIGTIGGEAITLVLQKTPLLEELDRVFPGGKAAETGLTFDAATGKLDGFDTAALASATAVVIDDEIDLDDIQVDELRVVTSTIDPDDDLLV
ncbi:hypothetical protein L905_19130 [Agrobacterium sp. TS43]|uniref:hypothetical protein n=1 Tax=Agrobacterium TaxID=357 RepID=UPI00049EC66F|nr:MULTISPECIES: hypothetical protein [Agrobacterium]KDR87711.1 hypothetical protein K538_07100 [Agrobacterium tumefaciens GW4]KVK49505.1 hypothetical protein L903_19490 [Agrobacterium sp. JL28]KVK49742.1 hypothetical protein L904_19480 [Agrobacterium sp. LY4]KVK62683.1 hypothetical protein L906_18605 [Agrobacterium sp. TS45]KVK65068.1 hypothetical protein L905_19130 [Agrobacterium sp. TS43]